MSIGAKPQYAIVFLMVLTLGVSLGLQAEDVLDAVYDESETLPCEVIPLFSIAAPLVAARITQAMLSSSRHKPAAVPPLIPAHFLGDKAKGALDTRTSLALLCTLLC